MLHNEWRLAWLSLWARTLDRVRWILHIAQYNRYCHFVAGLVREGLSRLFAASGLEKASFAGELHLSDQMGLFLQKINIIRDYLEDYVDGRACWPQSVWKKYSKSGDLGYFSNQADPEARVACLYCLNELITDGLELVPDCLAYMSKLQCVEVFRFCAIPQVMAIATYEKCYANPDVFTGVVKIRKGLSCKLILRTNNMPEVHDTFHSFAESIMKKARDARKAGAQDPSYERTIKACETILELTAVQAAKQRTANAVPVMLAAVCVLVLVAYKYVADASMEPIIRGAVLVALPLLYQHFGQLTSDLKTAETLMKSV
jgi:farnesyl-diphosphate farnesyltransferase